MAYTTIDDPESYYNTVSWTGTGSSQSITGVGFQPDIIITKCTSHAGTSGNHAGWKVTNSSNGTDVQWKGEEYGSQHWEHAWATDTEIITAFGSDGFTVGTDVEVNQSGRSYVAYCWKVNGGTTSTIAAGSTTYDPSETEVQVNSTSKVSIMQYQGSTSYGSISHGLGAKPHCFWAKSKNHASNAPPVMWGDSGDSFSNYNQWSAGANYTGIMDAEPDTSRVHLIDNNLVFRPQGANSYTAMAWVEVQGFSKFSQYEGNGSDDGPFVYTGFKPALVFIKNKERVCDWVIFDSKRETRNPMVKHMSLSNDSEEGSSAAVVIDFLANGFKIRDDHDNFNNSGEVCNYWAWAEKPFVTSDDGGSIPCTAQ